MSCSLDVPRPYKTQTKDPSPYFPSDLSSSLYIISLLTTFNISLLKSLKQNPKNRSQIDQKHLNLESKLKILKQIEFYMDQISFESLRELHDCANYLLDHCPKTRESLSQRGQEKWTEQVSEASLKMLDICNVSKDVMTLVKHSLQDLQLTLRTNESSDVNEKIAAYNQYKNRLKKAILKCLNCLKSMKGSEVMPIEYNLLFVAEVLKEVRRAVVTMVESLFSLGCIPWLEKRSSKGSLSSIFTIRSSYWLDDIWDETAVQSAATRLEAAEIAVEELEIELESIFRRLIHTRVSLLNIITS